MDRPAGNVRNVTVNPPDDFNNPLQASQIRLKSLYAQSSRVLVHDVKYAPVPPYILKILTDIESKPKWHEHFRGFQAALSEYLKQRATLPVTSMSLPVPVLARPWKPVQAELEASAVSEISAQALDALPFSAGSLVMAALHVLAEADVIMMGMLQCGGRPCLTVTRVRGQSTATSKRSRAAARSAMRSRIGKPGMPRMPVQTQGPPYVDGGMGAVPGGQQRAFPHHAGPRQELGGGRFLTKHS
eukprot:jgi/Ulvmu1/7813/UM004_0042.1